jgi:hypothetical protein
MNLTGLSREALEEYAHNLEAIVAECRGEQDDQDLVTDHPFTPATFTDAWPGICGYEVDGLPCGYSRAEHAARLERAEGGEAIEEP